VFFSALLIVIAICLAFFLLSASIRSHTKSLLAATLAQRQRAIVSYQAEGLEQLLRTSALMTDSPTLRAAMETYRDEAGRSPHARPDLLETIQTEVDRIAAALGRDLFVVTDDLGNILAWNGGPGAWIRAGEGFSSHPTIRRALERDLPVPEHSSAVMDLGGELFRVSSVPILLRGFVIGSLTVGERIDHHFVQRLQANFDCDVVVLSGGRVVGSTLRTAPAPADLRELVRAVPHDASTPQLTELVGAEYVAVGMSLGSDAAGRDVQLYLLNSLTAVFGQWSRSVVLLVVAWGLVAVALAGFAAWRMARSVLRPLEDFVGFMRSVAHRGDLGRRFIGAAACLEVETLNDTYNQLMDSLLDHERRLRERAREDLDRLERLKESEKLAALGRMLSGAAHEINNPLTGVLGNIELLLGQEGLQPATRSRLERVRQEGRRVVALVRNLLKASHRDSGERTPVDVHQVLREAADVRRHDFTGAGMSLDLALWREPIRVLGSELELHQVFLNIINNAFDALREASGERRLVARTEIADGHAVVTFSDSGPGMKDPGKVFEHFYTTKGIGKGTGLGLSICHTIVQQHGGRIAAENIEGGGARFLVTLPLAAAQAGSVQAVPVGVAPPPPTDDADHRPLRASVLIVDDEPTIVDLQLEILTALEAEAVGVASGDEAIEILGRRTFDIVVTDMRMPGSVSGKELHRWVQSNRPEAASHFVFVTGDTSGEETDDYARRTGVRLLAKPFSMQEYIRTLRELHEAHDAKA
jgi:signal transduction histidine kinase